MTYKGMEIVPWVRREEYADGQVVTTYPGGSKSYLGIRPSVGEVAHTVFVNKDI